MHRCVLLLLLLLSYYLGTPPLLFLSSSLSLSLAAPPVKAASASEARPGRSESIRLKPRRQVGTSLFFFGNHQIVGTLPLITTARKSKAAIKLMSYTAEYLGHVHTYLICPPPPAATAHPLRQRDWAARLASACASSPSRICTWFSPRQNKKRNPHHGRSQHRVLPTAHYYYSILRHKQRCRRLFLAMVQYQLVAFLGFLQLQYRRVAKMCRWFDLGSLASMTRLCVVEWTYCLLYSTKGSGAMIGSLPSKSKREREGERERRMRSAGPLPVSSAHCGPIPAGELT